MALLLIACLGGSAPQQRLGMTTIASRTRARYAGPAAGPVLAAADTVSPRPGEELTVHVIPHSHCDLGWLDTAEVCMRVCPVCVLRVYG